MGCMDSSGSKTVSQSQSTPMSAEQQATLNKALELYTPTLGAGQPIYTGETVAPFSGLQADILSNLGDFLDLFSATNEMPLYGETGTALSGILSGTTGADYYTPELVNELYSSIYEQPAKKEYLETTAPAIKEAYAGPGYWGSSRARAEMEGAQDLQDWLGTKYGEMRMTAEQANRALQEARAERALSAMPLGMEYAAQPTQEAAARLAGQTGLFSLASTQQAQQQAEINASINKWLAEQRITDPENMEIILSLLNLPGGTSYSTSTGGSWGSGLGYNALLGWLSPGGLFAGA